MTVRIIPRLDVKGPNLVKGIHLEGLRVMGHPESYARRYYQDGADEIIYLDQVASLYGRNNLAEIVSRAAEEIYIPLTVGGGIRSVEDIQRLLRAGADKVAINTGAIADPQLISDGARTFGSQCIVVAMDVKREGDGWQVYTHGGRRPTGIDAIAWAQEVTRRGAGEILLTSMDQDGRQTGFDLAITAAISERVNVPVIASGGGGTIEHFHQALTTGKADAVLAASVFHYGQLTVPRLKQALRERGVPVRLTPEMEEIGLP